MHIGAEFQSCWGLTALLKKYKNYRPCMWKARSKHAVMHVQGFQWQPSSRTVTPIQHTRTLFLCTPLCTLYSAHAYCPEVALMLRGAEWVNLMCFWKAPLLPCNQWNHSICLLFLSDVVLGKAHPGPLDNLVCNSKYKIERFLIKEEIERREQ